MAVLVRGHRPHQGGADRSAVRAGIVERLAVTSSPSTWDCTS
ncbi:hypothetical protein QJS66_04380 [Kocuria rhizophila]|nr:hypothetical protein QJS66_04380 [Kocuria rhizophila]